MLVKKFLIFSRPLRCRLDRVQLLVRVAMKLHNMCIDSRLGDERGGRGVHRTDITGDRAMPVAPPPRRSLTCTPDRQARSTPPRRVRRRGASGRLRT